MPYDVEIDCHDIAQGDIFQAIQKMLGVLIPSDATDPLDHASPVLLRTSPMAPVKSGSDHDLGAWLPIRRTRVATVATDPVDETIVDDAEPFKVGDTVQAIDVAGPATAVTDLGAITAIDYDTNTITTTNAANALAIDDWIEVTENGSADTDHFIGTADNEIRQAGMLRRDLDLRINADGDVQIATAEVVTEGVIREEDIWFNTTPTLDEILLGTFQQRAPLSIHIVQRPHA